MKKLFALFMFAVAFSANANTSSGSAVIAKWFAGGGYASGYEFSNTSDVAIEVFVELTQPNGQPMPSHLITWNQNGNSTSNPLTGYITVEPKKSIRFYTYSSPTNNFISGYGRVKWRSSENVYKPMVGAVWFRSGNQFALDAINGGQQF